MARMRLRSRGSKAVMRIWPGLKSSPWMISTAVDLFVAGWHARGRADRLTKAQLAVVEAAQRCHNRDFRDGVNDLVKALADLERAKSKGRNRG